ncbi:MAG TPA: hypothetical protein VK737_05930 [Opitutales bacterium]|jgi:hypothetical protein|nr:hypothetical protein [Opitutales bacterium]
MVYRPSKKTPTGPGFPKYQPSGDPLDGPLEQASGASGVLKGDDRNLVRVDDTYAGGDFEDRLWIFWRKQKTNIIRGLVTLCVAVVVWQGWSFYQAHQLANLQADYQAAKGASALSAFAQAHPQTTLGQIAQLEAADALYKDGKFKEAADAYSQAATLLGSDEKAARARLGQAVALIQSGDAKSGESQLETVTNDTSAAENFRAEASYYLALLAAQAGDSATATKWLEHTKEFKTSSYWITQAATLTAAMPLIGEIKSVAVGSLPKPPSKDTKDSLPVSTPASPSTSTTSLPAIPAPAKSSDTGFPTLP